MVDPITRASVPDLVFASLCDAILSGRYEPGERLPTQRTLAADLNVNMASVREALKRLEQLRLVEVRHGDATRVLDWRRSGGLEALAVLGGIDGTSVVYRSRTTTTRMRPQCSSTTDTPVVLVSRSSVSPPRIVICRQRST